MRSLMPALVISSMLGAGARPSTAASPDLRGAWRPEIYTLKDGAQHPVDGLIFFSEKDWTVLFFVTVNGEPRRGSAEGGTYTLEGNRLVFTHLYDLSAGQAVAGLPESPLSMQLKDKKTAATEPCEVELAFDRLTLRFPTGNTMTFRRSSRF